MDQEVGPDMVIVGAGFAGMYMLHLARRLGLQVRVLEAAGDVGGTWYWNRYPGARCDIESLEYSYGFDEELQQEWTWSERYATQSEILGYARHVAECFDLRRDITFDTRVVSAQWSDASSTWTVSCDSGEVIRSRFVVMATGCLSSPNRPLFDDIEHFTGRLLHTGEWPHAPVSFAGERVAVIGTGSSAIQSIPVIAAEAEQLVVFQRTPAYSVPAHNRPLTADEVADVKAHYAEFRAANRAMPAAFGSRLPGNPASALAVDANERAVVLEERWEHGGLAFLGAFNDVVLDLAANAAVAQFVRAKIAATVIDPQVAARLMPSTPIGCKRMCVDTDFYATFNRPNVELVDLSEQPVERFTPDGLIAGGVDRRFDSVVLATGFDAITGALLRIDVRGRRGVALCEAWADGARSYLGLQISGFPNLFTITGPGSPAVLTNMIVSIEHHVEWIAAAIDDLRRRRLSTIEPTPEAEQAWGDTVDAIADFTVFPSCNSWYIGANVAGKPRRFLPFVGFPMYAAMVAEITADGYRGFLRS